MNTVTLKEIADAANVSVDTVRRNLKRWGLSKCRSKAREYPMIFFRGQASDALLRHRVISTPL